MIGSHLRFGRQARAFDTRIPHMSALRFGFGKPAIPLPPAKDYSHGLSGFGMMLNDRISDCTCAAYYHARQVWSYNSTGKMMTEPDSDVEKLYAWVTGYKPKAKAGNPLENPTDRGAKVQDILRYLYRTGAPLGSTGSSRDKILGYVEVDPSIPADMKRTIFECGVAYIGFVVPAGWIESSPPRLWDAKPGDPRSKEGHSVILAGYDTDGYVAISWGEKYKMTSAFVSEFVDEAYAIADRKWFNHTGQLPLGMDRGQLETIMQHLL